MHPAVTSREADLRRLCAQHGVRRLAIFGSAAAAGATTVGDFDFLVEFRPMPPVEHADSYFGLLADLERLFHAPVDLVERDALRNPFFKRSIEASRVVLYDAA